MYPHFIDSNHIFINSDVAFWWCTFLEQIMLKGKSLMWLDLYICTLSHFDFSTLQKAVNTYVKLTTNKNKTKNQIKLPNLRSFYRTFQHQPSSKIFQKTPPLIFQPAKIINPLVGPTNLIRSKDNTQKVYIWQLSRKKRTTSVTKICFAKKHHLHNFCKLIKCTYV